MARRKPKNVSLPLGLIEQIQAASARTLIPQSRIFERALREWLARENAAAS